ncbi:hypothetical protein nbrc107696_24280 [Gordonia spumicola]|uniref:Uncharacterized protein n=1 Tax=Gordonia spumicola TaxID=589161 RepID=A0A7I9V9R3_9ACTN|nr:hypothetical protein nbrc107696_24280 [Gordonia spumicola]
MFCRSRCTHPGQWPETDSPTGDDDVADQWSIVMPGSIVGLVTCGVIAGAVISGDIVGADDMGGAIVEDDGAVIVDDIGGAISLVGFSSDEESFPQAVSRARATAPARTAPATVRREIELVVDMSGLSVCGRADRAPHPRIRRSRGEGLVPIHDQSPGGSATNRECENCGSSGR